jgi:methionine biosynthesis protein MetW
MSKPEAHGPLLARLPGARFLLRNWRKITGPAPYRDFRDYDEYWQARIRDDRRAGVLHRHVWIAQRLRPGESLLDVGCGDGAFLRYLRDAAPGVRAAGADIAPTAVAELRRLGIDCYPLEEGRRLETQVPGGWDTVVLMEVIEHVHEAEDLMRQVMALGPKRIILTLPNVGFIVHRLRLALGGRFPVTTIFYHMKEHIRFWTVKDMYQWAEYLGLRVVAHHGQFPGPGRLERWLIRRAPGLFAALMIYELVPAGTTGRDDAPASA